MLRAFPQIAPVEANIKILEEYCRPDDVVSVEAIQFAFENGSPLLDQLAISTDAENRQRLVETIVRFSKGNDKDKEFLRRNLHAKFRSGNPIRATEELQRKATEAQTRVDLSVKTVEELQKITRSSLDAELVGPSVASENAYRSSRVLIDGRYYAPVPKEITSEMIRTAGSRSGVSVAELKKWMRQYHPNQINARLNG